MNFGLIISYVIAGFLMIMIFTINYNVGFSNQEVTTTLIKETHTQAVKQILTNDIPKIGYQQGGVITNTFIKATDIELSYRSDLDNDGSVETITWTYDPDTTPAHANNPHVNTLIRTVDGVDTDITLGITDFQIRYYNQYGSTSPMSTPVSSSDFEDIVQIEIEFEMQNDYSLNYRASDPDRYITTNWQKRFSPVNLRPN
ncbi:MAG TPA: hypothetical protein VJ941_09070 [Gracilimonas sp.]|nr:hypothetical protein [Gracilimonas sp.]